MQIASCGALHTCFGVAFTHTLAAAAATLDRSKDTIHIRSATPFLMREYIYSKFLLARLDESNVGKHSLIFEGARELSGDGGVGVKTSEGDQLENETKQKSARSVESMQQFLPMLGNVPNERFQGRLSESLSHPVE